MNDGSGFGDTPEALLLAALAGGRTLSRARLQHEASAVSGGPVDDVSLDTCLDELVRKGAVVVSHVQTLPPQTLYRDARA